jgi:hypothetical protein
VFKQILAFRWKTRDLCSVEQLWPKIPLRWNCLSTLLEFILILCMQVNFVFRLGDRLLTKLTLPMGRRLHLWLLQVFLCLNFQQRQWIPHNRSTSFSTFFFPDFTFTQLVSVLVVDCKLLPPTSDFSVLGFAWSCLIQWGMQIDPTSWLTYDASSKKLNYPPFKNTLPYSSYLHELSSVT